MHTPRKPKEAPRIRMETPSSEWKRTKTQRGGPPDCATKHRPSRPRQTTSQIPTPTPPDSKISNGIEQNSITSGHEHRKFENSITHPNPTTEIRKLPVTGRSPLGNAPSCFGSAKWHLKSSPTGALLPFLFARARGLVCLALVGVGACKGGFQLISRQVADYLVNLRTRNPRLLLSFILRSVHVSVACNKKLL